MKKRFLLIPLVLIGAPIGIGIADAAVHMTGCSLGHKGACAELSRRKQHSKELAAKDDALRAALKAKRDAEQAEAAAKQAAADKAEAERFIPVQERVASAERQGAVRQCEATFKPALKDPNSYRYLAHQYVAQGRRALEIRVNYTATNSFGGRIQDVQTCTYTL